MTDWIHRKKMWVRHFYTST